MTGRAFFDRRVRVRRTSGVERRRPTAAGIHRVSVLVPARGRCQGDDVPPNPPIRLDIQSMYRGRSPVFVIGQGGPHMHGFQRAAARATLLGVTLAVTACSGGGGDAPQGNRAPVASDDQASTTRGEPVDVNVLANDVDPDGDPLVVSSTTQPSHGSVTHGPLRVTYLPAAGYTGDDAFTYTVSDGKGATATATVHVTVTAPNAAPVATPFVMTVSAVEDVPLVLVLTGTDAEDLAADLQVELAVTPMFGTLTPASGPAPLVVTYTPAGNYSGADSFAFRVVDTAGARSTPVAVSISVAPVNDAPVAAPLAPLVTDEDVPVAVTLTGADVESAEYLLVVSIVTNPAHGSVALAPNPAPLATAYVPDPDFSGVDSFSYRVTDPGGEPSEVVTVSVTVNAVNDLPSATPRNVNATEDVAAAIVLTGTDVESATADLSVELVAPPAHGTVSPATGPAPLSVSYLPATNYAGPDSFTYRVRDPDGGVSDPATVSIAVAAVDDPPFATSIAPVGTDAGVAVSFVLTGTDPDDAVTALRISVQTLPQHGTLTATSGWAPLSVTYTPAPGWSGTDGLTFRVNDPLGAQSGDAAVAIVVLAPVPHSPVAVADAAVACPGESVRVAVLANDTDADGDPLTLASVTQGAQGTVAISGKAAVYAADAGGSGSDSFEYTVSDGTGRAATGTVTVTYSGPVITSLFPASGTTGGPLQISGRCFGASAGTVTIGGRPATVSTWTSSYLVATVPTDFAPGSHAVVATLPSLAAATASYEIVPWIGLVEPYYVASGAPQSVLGDAFVTPAGSVLYDATAAQVDGWTNTTIQSRMPRESSFDLKALTSSGLTSNEYPVTAAGPATWRTERVPGGRLHHTAVWTGTEMIVWGGENTGSGGLGGGTSFSSGGRYDPRFDSWVPTATITPARRRHSAVWSGKEMIVWGGYTTSGDAQTGQRYVPGTDTWTATNTTNAPSAREQHTAVWTGTRMIVWGGYAGVSYLSTGGSYDPVSDTWTPLPALDAPAARVDHVAVWTGKEMIVWGGQAGAGGLATGARFDPAANRWRPVSTVGAPSARSSFAAVWTGTEMIVWGGLGAASYLQTGARYDPETDEWAPLPTTGAPEARFGHVAVWTGKEMIVWGGYGMSGTGHSVASGGRYDPRTNTWTATDVSAAPLARVYPSAIWTGTEMIVWGGSDGALDTGARYAPAADTWTPTRVGAPGEPTGRYETAWACVAGDLVVWSGYASGRGPLATGARYDRSSGAWSPLATLGAPSARAGATALWTGTHLIVWGGRASVSGTTTYLADGARWDPALDEWVAMSTTGAPSARSGHTAVWAGSRMIVWGGENASAVLQTGAMYDPDTDTWEALPVDVSTPEARRLHTAVSTGTEMIVWGGSNRGSTTYSNGARFDVASRSWTALPPSGLSARARHSAVWTGTEMIVWGGDAMLGANGAAFAAASGIWSSITTGPARRKDHSAVWNGTEMIVWGGHTDGSSGPVYDATPYRYDPAGKTWTTGSLAGAPLGRDGASACWTGTDLAVWGGSYNGYGLGALGHYRP